MGADCARRTLSAAAAPSGIAATLEPMKPIFLRAAALFVLLGSVPCPAQETPPRRSTAATSGELFETISRLDLDTFAAFNAHDVGRLMASFSSDLEFYHDTGGVTDHRQTRENFRSLFERVPDIRRTIVPGSLEVYPIKDHGALEIGEHRFCHQENGKKDCGTFKFAMIWRKEGDAWKLSRVISYAH